MVRRAENVDETRRRIIEATVRLHTTVGPASTTIAAIAEEAGVTRLTVYRHFPELEPLFVACNAHWRAAHPMPDPGRWGDVRGVSERARFALTELYAYYRANAADLRPIYRDVTNIPAPTRKAMGEEDEALARALAGADGDGSGGRRVLAAARHLVRFETWSSLASDGGLGDADAADLGAALLLAAREPSASA